MVACGEDALVETFETAAQQDDSGALRELAHAGLGERLAARGEGEDGDAVRDARGRSA